MARLKSIESLINPIHTNKHLQNHPLNSISLSINTITMNNKASADSENYSSTQEVIDIDEDDEPIVPINKKLQCYFGLFGIVLEQNQLRLELRLKENPDEALTSDDIQVLQKDQYDLTQPILLYINSSNMTKSLRKSYKNISGLAKYLQRFIGNPQEVIVAADKLILNCSKQQSNPEQVVEIYYNYFKKVQKSDVIRDLRKVQETYAAISEADMQFIDPDLLLASIGFTEEEMLALYGDGDSTTSQSSDSNEKSEDGEGDEQTEGRDDSEGEDQDQRQPRDNISFASQLQPNYHNPYQSSSSLNPKPQTFKQNQIPIWQRFRGVDTNIPRKEKIKLAEKMLRIGYSKQEIIRFFSGGAEEMEAEGNRLPDYRNPQSERYKSIHLIVARKQHQRHNQLLRRYSLPPIPQLPDYAGQIIPNQRRTHDRKIKQLLIRFVKEKKFKKLDEIQQEMRRNGEQVSLHEIKRHIEQLKRRNLQKRQLEKKHGDMTEHNPDDDFA